MQNTITELIKSLNENYKTGRLDISLYKELMAMARELQIKECI